MTHINRMLSGFWAAGLILLVSCNPKLSNGLRKKDLGRRQSDAGGQRQPEAGLDPVETNRLKGRKISRPTGRKQMSGY